MTHAKTTQRQQVIYDIRALHYVAIKLELAVVSLNLARAIYHPATKLAVHLDRAIISCTLSNEPATEWLRPKLVKVYAQAVGLGVIAKLQTKQPNGFMA